MSRYTRDRKQSRSVVNKPTAVTIPFRWFAPKGLLLGLILFLSIACGEEAVTLTPTSTVPDSPTLVTITTPKPTDTPISTATRVPSSKATLALTLTPSPAPTPTPTPTPTQAPLPSPTAEPILPVVEGSTAAPAPLTLEVTSPSGHIVVDTATVNVVGTTSPDATVSVNGNLVAQDVAGQFTIELNVMPWENPLAIEVIASSLNGESKSLIRTVIFVP